MIEFDYTVLIHRLYDNGVPKLGGLDLVLNKFLDLGKAFIYIESPLVINSYPYLTVSLKSKDSVKILKKSKIITLPFIGRIHAFLLSIYFSLKYCKQQKVFITSDPLTTFAVFLLKRLGKVKFLYYHCIDYSEKRFNNFILEKLYKYLLSLGLNTADLVGCVTKRIEQILQEKGIVHTMYVPNSPSLSQIYPYIKEKSERSKNNLVMTCAGISPKYRVIDTLVLFQKIADKYPDATLTLVGSTKFDEEGFKKVENFLKTYKHVDKVKLTGHLTKEENTKVVAASWVGLAFYDKSFSHVNYGDSLKIREYAALNIPIVSDKTTPTSLEMIEWKAGFAVDEPWDAFDPICKILDNEGVYNSIMKREQEWAVSVDKDKIILELLKKIDA